MKKDWLLTLLFVYLFTMLGIAEASVGYIFLLRLFHTYGLSGKRCSNSKAYAECIEREIDPLVGVPVVCTYGECVWGGDLRCETKDSFFSQQVVSILCFHRL